MRPGYRRRGGSPRRRARTRSPAGSGNAERPSADRALVAKGRCCDRRRSAVAPSQLAASWPLDAASISERAPIPRSRQAPPDPLGAPAARARACPRHSARANRSSSSSPDSIRRGDAASIRRRRSRASRSQACSSAPPSAPCAAAPRGRRVERRRPRRRSRPAESASTGLGGLRSGLASGCSAAVGDRRRLAGRGCALDAEGIEELRLDLAAGLGFSARNCLVLLLPCPSRSSP